ncbi:MAG: selenobiotic family peptide radical SAM maturase [Candidatus Omnitrophica bacterium]|nr:selenobiotic family peptide radical SAM maturase [Candidatus Omnitrophota bacterium]
MAYAAGTILRRGPGRSARDGIYLWESLTLSMDKRDLEKRYPVCCSLIEEPLAAALAGELSEESAAEDLKRLLEREVSSGKLAEYIPELAGLEEAICRIEETEHGFPGKISGYRINPALDILELSWSFSDVMDPLKRRLEGTPEDREERALLWKVPGTGELKIERAGPGDLLALKLVYEEPGSEAAATAAGLGTQELKSALKRAAAKGLLLKPESLLKRYIKTDAPEPEFQKADIFTLQWHITNACDLNCRHCYDRSEISPLRPEAGRRLLGDMERFCEKQHAEGHVCFTGGNPFMYPHFFELYEEAAHRGFSTSILANPVTGESLERLSRIQEPEYFQVSLEGFSGLNDYMRGKGHFSRTVKFLGLLREKGISGSVMLTLTKDNIAQVTGLAAELEGKVDYFTFNRLSRVGEGEALLLPDRGEYLAFLRDYVKASENNPVMGFKDNLINTVLREKGAPPFDGCTGQGCGAAFNFLAVLPDGEAHACRKFPSPLGNVIEQGIEAIYYSPLAGRYRQGPGECEGCALALKCRGCMAAAYSEKKDMFIRKDPYCPL